MNKRQRKIKSANKLLRQQRKTLNALCDVKLACMAAQSSALVATIVAAKRLKTATSQEIADETKRELKTIGDRIKAKACDLNEFRNIKDQDILIAGRCRNES